MGKNYADDFAKRGYEVIRYDRHEFKGNAKALRDCEIVFIAVPTPTTPDGFDLGAVESSLGLLRPGTTAVIKSTIVVGSTEKLQAKYPDLLVMHSPEFLTEKTAAYDAEKPNRNIIGISREEHRQAAAKVLAVLPKAPYAAIIPAKDAEFIKYGGNCWFYFKVIFMNIFYDLVQRSGGDFQKIIEGMAADPRIGSTHLVAVHQGGRGAGGHCFIKDFEAFIEMVSKTSHQEAEDSQKIKLLTAMRDYNIDHLLCKTGKDIDLVKGIYGEDRCKSKI